MLYSKYFLPTTKEDPAEAEVISHKLMLRSGMIRKLSTGIYTYMPLGLKSIRKVEKIVREEMNKAGAIELLMPSVQPSEIWKASGRWNFYGKELLRVQDRHSRDYCIGPTHEEVITDLVKNDVHSYRQLPLNLYQIQTKFRDEVRPRFGVMRGREFIMKDAYSFDRDEAGAEESYWKMHKAYCSIFQRLGLEYKVVEADTGSIGGNFSHEFMVLADTGEDQIVNCNLCDYAANLEKAEIKQDLKIPVKEKLLPIEQVHTPDKRTINEVSSYLEKNPGDLIKTMIFIADKEPIAAIVKGDHEINHAKLKNILNVDLLETATLKEVKDAADCEPGFIGPVGLKIRVIADNSIKSMSNFITGANKKDYHLKGVNTKRDFKVDIFADIRNAEIGDLCPRCNGVLNFKRGIEAGHIFKLGTKYSQKMSASFLDQNGKEKQIIMGCYGIGITRIVAAAIEQGHDNDGIIFPDSIAPFNIIIIPITVKPGQAIDKAFDLYNELTAKGIDVLLDDRDERPGIKFKDADLTGIPYRITVGDRGLAKGIFELKPRNQDNVTEIPVEKAIEIIMEKVNFKI